ncbi:alpha/beta fold hydrolase, partial [Oleiphilus sp. HI0125]
MNDAQKALAQWREQGRFFEFEGHQVFYQDSQDANKPVLVMLHGFPTSSWDWQEIWPRLTQYFRVITFDFLGFGFSDKPNLPKYSIMMQASIAEALVNACGVADYHLLAHDYGNTVAQELLA